MLNVADKQVGEDWMVGKLSTEIASQQIGDLETIETRFGAVRVSKTNPIIFPRGLLGMPDKYHFCLTEFPTEKLQQFKLLQSLDDVNLSFITLPLDLKNPIVDEKDIIDACADLEVPMDDLALLVIVSVHRSPQAVKLSVNARAPLFIDAQRRFAAQYVFQNDKYKVQHIISG